VAALRRSGGFNDYDSIEAGNGNNDGLTPVERQTQMSLWALGSAPLILGVDLTHLNQLDLQKYLKNTAVLAVDQDSIPAKRVLNTSNRQVLAKMEPNGDAIVGLFNTGGKAEKVSIQASWTHFGPLHRYRGPITGCSHTLRYSRSAVTTPQTVAQLAMFR
jgi:hypothetical protein